MQTPSLSAEDKSRYGTLNRENLDFLMNRYNRVNRWVIADMIRRSCYHYPDKTAVVFGEKSMTYRELEEASNRVANGLADLGVKKYDRVAILAHNTIHHVLTW
ncbi:MAG: AMP-binding protein, partial [Desulfococcus multivorans]|nr:AMP-binding protein [Desulfococcus multivorans]